MLQDTLPVREPGDGALDSVEVQVQEMMLYIINKGVEEVNMARLMSIHEKNT